MSDMQSNLAKDLAECFSASDTITISSPDSWSNTTIGGGYTVTNAAAITGTIGNYPNITVSSGTGIASPWATTTATPWLGQGLSADANNAGRLHLTGENADINVNGVSLMDTLKRLEERLNILHPNEKLEAEWEELRELGDRYRKLEAKLKEQGEMWDRLKAMPAPEVK